jgi:hypothetical protein
LEAERRRISLDEVRPSEFEELFALSMPSRGRHFGPHDVITW